MPRTTTFQPHQTDVMYWRARAEEARVTAETFNDPEARGIMLDIADSYDSLADVAEQIVQRSAIGSEK